MIARLAATAAILAALAGCGLAPPSQPASRAVATGPAATDVAFPAETLPRGVARANRQLAADFLDLTFALERGETLRGLLRHEGPIRVYLRSPELAPYAGDIENLLRRFRDEARIDIRSTRDPSEARIHIDGVPLAELQRIDAGAACFIVPGETSWSGFRARSGRDRLRWSSQRTLGVTAIFIPTDSFPQDIRDCLHEELAQALGPANDLYRLPDSVFNDDNFHSILTPFDMLMLRALYDDALRSGLPHSVVAGRIGPILARINPQGEGIGELPRAPASAEFKRSIEEALTRRHGAARRIAAANRALAAAQRLQPADHRLGVALITRGRLTRDQAPERAAADFRAAYRLFRDRYGPDDIRTAQAALHVALTALEQADFDAADRLATQAIPVARRGHNAVLLSSLLAIRAAALTATGDRTGARQAQLDHLRWARYAYGDGNGTRAREQARLEALLPQMN
ncbi:DUF2927 domain-containing protein [Rhodobacteraceae bacterium 2CG4]|uniref:DUF2927 domain-containing protein n=1 Tax=Halovulum marinum TaxID=2662447 RepID=A0A6L5Z0E8_9RHOB|nr:DUF2927 domain-containing protein [Halovulum marinum]MSU89779.1 DUF2927 domain-containing protein [Halovulum marinum]